MNPHELRETFLRFFEERGHKRIPGAPIVPAGDPTLLFTSAGMVPFKPYFTGQADPPSPRMVSVQKCFRTTDIESVGDPSHLTFFEMLGNFSIGDYFKAEVIPWAHEYLTQAIGLPQERLWPAVFETDDEAFELWVAQGYPAERIMRYGEEENYWFSGDVGPCGPDSEIHYDFGEQFGCGPDCHPAHGHDRFVEIWNLVFMTYYCDGEKREPLPKKNIDTGAGFERQMQVLLHNSPGWDKKRMPSVYDTEVFQPMIRRIEQLSGKKYGKDEATDRAIRIVAEHSRAVTFLIGDERTPVVPSNEERGYVCRRMLRRAMYFGRRHLGIEKPFMVDLANTVIGAMKDSHPELERQRKFINEIIAPEEQRFDQTLHVGSESLADVIHARMQIQELIDNWKKETAQVLHNLGSEDWGLMLHEPADHVSSGLLRTWMALGSSPRIKPPSALVQRFAIPLTELFDDVISGIQGMSDVTDQAMAETKTGTGDARTLGLVKERIGPARTSFDAASKRFEEAASEVARQITGVEAFVLHDTYGFPIDLTRDIAEQNGFAVDIEGFEREMAQQRERARASAGGAEHVAAETLYASLSDEATRFTGYEELETKASVVALLSGGAVVDQVTAGEKVEVLLDATPFYPEGGGQVGDRGEIVTNGGRVEVLDTQRVAGKLIVHRGRVVEGRTARGDQVTARVDPAHRAHTKRNHTATHLLHAALREVIGPHVRQAGSLVAPDHLRFDFTHTEAVTQEQLAAVESLVNEKVRQDVPVHSRETSFDEAMQEGVLAFFGDKYGDRVRVVEVNTSIPRFSAELCGGTHCEHTGEIGAIIITGESSIGSGMRRIEALTGAGAERHIREQGQLVDDVARSLGVPRGSLKHKIDSLLAENVSNRRSVEKLERALASGPQSGDLSAYVQDVDGLPVLFRRVDAPSVEALRFMGDAARKSMPAGLAVLGSVIGDRAMIIVLSSEVARARGINAAGFSRNLAETVGGKGGGRADTAQGGGPDLAKLDELIASVPQRAREFMQNFEATKQ